MVKSVLRHFFKNRYGEPIIFRSRISNQSFKEEMLEDAETLRKLGLKYQNVINIELSKKEKVTRN